MATTASTAATPTPAPRRRLGPAERRSQILVAAAGPFAADGFGQTSIAAIAAAAGVTPRIVYRHFASKDAIYRSLLERTHDGLAAVFAEPVGPYGVDPAVLLGAGRADVAGFRILWRHAAHEPAHRPVAEACRAKAVACARAGLAPWTPAESVEWAARAVVGYQLEAVLNWLDYGTPADDARFARATRAALAAGVRAWAND